MAARPRSSWRAAHEEQHPRFGHRGDGGLQAKLGPSDRATVSDYLDVLREVERRIQQAEAKNAESPLPEYERPGIGVPERFDDHAKLMFDLLHLAFQGDITRVTTFMYGGNSGRACIRRSG